MHGVELARHHLLWADMFANTAESRMLIVSPPDTWKSRLTRYHVEHQIGNNPELCWLLVMNTAAQARKQVMSISDTLLNNGRYREVFPGITPDPHKSWTQEQVWVERKTHSRPDATLYGTGILGPYQGTHVERLVIDDPTDQEDVRHPDEMEKQEQRVKGTLIDRVIKGGRMYGLMTRWGQADLRSTFAKLGFTIIEMPIVGDYPWGPLLWPEEFPIERCGAIREDKGDALYSLTYLCQEDAEDATALFSGWQFYDDVPAGIPWVTSWDTAGTKTRTAAYSCGITIGRKGQDIFIKDLKRGRWEYPDLRKKALECYKEHRAPLWIEEKATGQSLVQDLRNLGREEGVHIPIVSIKLGKKYGMDGDKTTRAKVAARYVQAGRVWLPRKAPWINAFLAECHLLGRYMDQVDAFSQGVIRLMRTKKAGDLQVQFSGSRSTVVAPTVRQLRERRILREVGLRVVA